LTTASSKGFELFHSALTQGLRIWVGKNETIIDQWDEGYIDIGHDS